MPTFELTLKGFRSDTDATDHLIKWVWAETRDEISQILMEHELVDCVENVEQLEHIIDGHNVADDYHYEDGIDIYIDPDDGRTWQPGWTREEMLQFKSWPKESQVALHPPNNVYEGSHDADDGWYRVKLNGLPFDPAPSLEVRNHSPDGFSFGYFGSGPAQLALAILLEETGSIEIANRYYQDYKQEVIAKLPNANGSFWKITSEEVRLWLKAKIEGWDKQCN